jgi:hypothetical protein
MEPVVHSVLNSSAPGWMPAPIVSSTTLGR